MMARYSLKAWFVTIYDNGKTSWFSRSSAHGIPSYLGGSPNLTIKLLPTILKRLIVVSY